MANKNISDLTAVTTPAGTDLLEMEDAAGDSYKITASQVANITTGTDYDIGTGDKTADISALTATVGSSARYTWYDGDGTYTFSFTGTAGITIDGIASSEYVGEGVGHLDLFVVSAAACITINRGEVWDNDGGNFITSGVWSNRTWQKKLDGSLLYNAKITHGSVAMTSLSGNMGYRTVGTISDTTPDEIIKQCNDSDILLSPFGGSILQSEVVSVTVTTTTAISYYTSLYSSASASPIMAFLANCKWTTSYPRIT